MGMRRTVAGLAAMSALAVGVAGCFDVDETVRMERDLSGRAGFTMTVDMEPMVQMMADLQHGFSGEKGQATPEEVAKVRQEMLKDQQAQTANTAEQEAEKAKLASQLPPGVKLLGASMENQGLKMKVRIDFGFDDIRKLAQIRLPQDEKKSAAPGGANPYDTPFAGLKVVDEGKTLLVTLAPINPAQSAEKQAPPGALDDVTKKTLLGMFKNARFALTLDSPFTVVSTNATRRDGSKLYWEFNLADPAAQAPDTLTARLKK